MRNFTAAAFLTATLLGNVLSAGEALRGAPAPRSTVARTPDARNVGTHVVYADADGYSGSYGDHCHGGADCGGAWAPNCHDDPWARYGHVWDGYCQERACRESFWRHD